LAAKLLNFAEVLPKAAPSLHKNCLNSCARFVMCSVFRKTGDFAVQLERTKWLSRFSAMLFGRFPQLRGTFNRSTNGSTKGAGEYLSPETLRKLRRRNVLN
jgi:hypothetical protein